MYGKKLVLIKMKKNLLFISCEEAKLICDRAQYKEATLWEKIKLNLRYTWCRITRAYVKKNKKLTEAIKSSNVQCLKQNERQELHEQLKHQLKNQD